jgi:hypothetical protein
MVMRESEDGCSLDRVVAVSRKRAGLDFRRRITRLMAGEASLVGVELGPIMTPRAAITGKGKVLREEAFTAAAAWQMLVSVIRLRGGSVWT